MSVTPLFPPPHARPRASRPSRNAAGLAVAALTTVLVAACAADTGAPSAEQSSGGSFAHWGAELRRTVEEGRDDARRDGPSDAPGTGAGSGSDAADEVDGTGGARKGDRAPGEDTAGASAPLPVWGVPIGLEGWTIAQLDVDGVTKIASEDGCILAAQQLHVAFDTDDDRAASEDLLVQLIGPESYLPVERPVVTVSAPGGPLELLQHHVTYATPDSAVEYRYLSRAITEQDSGLLLAYSCPVDVFDEAGWLAVLALTSVAHTTTTTL